MCLNCLIESSLGFLCANLPCFRHWRPQESKSTLHSTSYMLVRVEGGGDSTTDMYRVDLFLAHLDKFSPLAPHLSSRLGFCGHAATTSERLRCMFLSALPGWLFLSNVCARGL